MLTSALFQSNPLGVDIVSLGGSRTEISTLSVAQIVYQLLDVL